MKITRVRCLGCGADLEIEDSIRVFNCTYCHARQEITRDAAADHTRLLETIARNTGQAADSLSVLELQNDLDRMDRQWKHEENGHKIFTGKNRPKALPTSFDNYAFGWIMGGLGVIALPFSFFIGGGAPIWAVVLIAAAACMHVYAEKRASAYKKALSAYQGRRYKLMQRIEEIRKR
ncbi:hypothetical protein OKA04_14435 [Luteolibacter flavescens]|uniref:Uncharacterized protein n=1 Tax=Luteolibacter flavescens TaxID=1859460 RepID=A0ABT3FQT2_9BACT|nr:hypothetical protein [Luteolibacter flavescens]MCW1885933.1 hypothetical protein [Luteolibacter flavescens]